MVDSRTNFAREISQLIRDTYGGKIRVFDTAITLFRPRQGVQCAG